MRSDEVYCTVCGSLNHLRIDDHKDLAWQCHHCKSKFWLDDLSMLAYMIKHDKTYSEIEFLLNNADFVDEGIPFAISFGDGDDTSIGLV